MATGMSRVVARAWFTRALRRRAHPITSEELLRSTLVIAPHPDDECLGCGGTILRLRDAGVPVKIAFLTDGSRSHSHLMPREELAAQRAQEAMAAACALSLLPQDVYLLGIEDGRLSEHRDAARRLILSILRNHRPEQIFVPYRGESPEDHFIANQVTYAALTDLDYAPQVREYPIWFWSQWPWTPVSPNRQAALPNMALRNLWSLWRLFRDFRDVVDIHNNLSRKRAALACHRSQMTRLVPDSRWLRLEDVADGDWLGCFFTNDEFFHTPSPKLRPTPVRKSEYAVSG